MISFKQYVVEKSVAGGFNIPRSQMPQLNDHQGFATYLSTVGVAVQRSFIAASNLRPTQTEYDQDKVDSMSAPYGPIIVADDLHVLDGHHRYFATLRDEEVTGMPQVIDAYMCAAPINQLLAHANEFLSDE